MLFLFVLISVLPDFLTATAQAKLIKNARYDDRPLLSEPSSVPVNLSQLFNNRGFARRPNESNFDGFGSAFPAQFLPPSTFVYAGINYSFPEYDETKNDNIRCSGQNVTVVRGRYSTMCLLASSQSGTASGNIIAHYVDGSSHASAILVPSWWSWPYPVGGDVVFPYFLTNSSINYNRSSIFQSCSWLPSTKDLVSLTLPNINKGSGSGPGEMPVGTKLHIFSLSLVLSQPAVGPVLNVRYARSTQKWIEGTNQTQIVEAIITNAGNQFVMPNNSVSINIHSPGLRTVKRALIKRLAPGDQIGVEIGVENQEGVTKGQSGLASIMIDGLGVASKNYTFNATYGITPYSPTYDSVSSHESPAWFNSAKFGIFIHWGVYAVPAWGNVGKNETYAEWYWWNLNRGPNTKDRTYQYHLEHYGPNVTYDDFIANFTALAFNPKEWVDLFAQSGAKYFVMVTKHHDGYALFDLPPTSSKRTSVALPPHRDFVREIFDAATKYQPHLRRGSYYSIPEWFHPDYVKYGFGSWPGGLAKDPFTNRTLPYTGYVPITDYFQDLLLPSMEALGSAGTEIMWCDIGFAPNVTIPFAAQWYNSAAALGKQVTMNNRCGLSGDFDTPEYPRSSPPVVRPRKYEVNQGIDPYSYGYNAATPEQAYMNASAIVKTLVDTNSKNGNFLLDIGPKSDGSIVDAEVRALTEAGAWIKDHVEAIFRTKSWFVSPQEGESIRFAVSEDAFYIYLLKWPGERVVIESPVPWVEGDNITIVGGNLAGRVVPSRKDEAGRLVIDVRKETEEADKWVWIFKITY